MKRPDPGSWAGRIQEKISSWQLPVRIPVPNRDNLIAIGLMALAFGLMVGVAIGPAMGSSSNAGATVATGQPSTVAETGTTDEVTTADADVPELGAPAGSEISSGDSSSLPDSDQTALVPADDPTDTSTLPPPSDEPVEPDTSEPDPPENKGSKDKPPKSLPGTALKGTVVGQGTNEKSYAIADRSGNILALHGSVAPPLASQVSTRIDPLANGTFSEERKWTTDGEKTDSPLRGVVSYIDPETGWIAISSRGVSIAVDAAEVLAAPAEQPVELGSQVEGEVTFPADLREDPDSGPLLVATKLEAIGDPGTYIELNGRVLSLDEEAGTMAIAPDSGGRLDTEIAVLLPDGFDPETVETGRTFNATVEAKDLSLIHI